MNKVTKAYIESQITDVAYSRGIGTITHCYITVKSGFVVIGESACVDEDKFDQKLGECYAYENAFEKLWQLFGFELKRKTGGDYKYRLEKERDDLKARVADLLVFLNKGQPDFIDDDEWLDMYAQLMSMQFYLFILEKRVKRHTNTNTKATT